MKNFLLLSFFALCAVPVCVAQTTTHSYSPGREIIIDNKTGGEIQDIAKDLGFSGELPLRLQQLKSTAEQVAVIKQVGDYNFAAVTQHGTELFAYILQEGSYLDAKLTIEGTNNEAVIKQQGTHLSTEVTLTGNNNIFKLLQKGTNLENHIKLLNVNGMEVFFLQDQSRFLYSQNGGNGIPLQIKQTGQTPAIIVTNN